ncbi:MAG: excinuclease ABC subunit UvrC [Clostridiales bacterium]|nr:excinuclease ABC subunit UvrC [Clostridiales bacterium]MCF8023579.1 excinuclease ABC subunit UvrC [Clostridiales bacterium]
MPLKEKLSHLPDKPGVYMFKDKNHNVIYVGKAVSLKNRVRSYFTKEAKKVPKVRAMTERMADFDYMVTDSEVEALILESNLIKEYRPRYNVLLRDDKSYPFLKVTVNEDYPRVFITRRLLKDGARYFGPYTRVGAVHDTLRLLKKLFPFRSCRQKTPVNRGRPCLNYYINRCPGPCCDLISKEDYHKIINHVIMFLEGRQEEVIKDLESRMEKAAESLEFEKAAELRDQLQAVREIAEKQKVLSSGQEDQDVLAMARGDQKACVMVFFIRSGKLIGRDHFMLGADEYLERAEILTSFIKQHYYQSEFIPKQILAEDLLEEEKETLAHWLSDSRGSKVYLQVPRRGEKKKLVDMAGKNALLALQEEENSKNTSRENLDSALEELAAALGIEEIPRRMECYDISNIQGTNAVASMVVFEDGKPDKNEYRKFKIKTVEGPDDFASMREVIGRRFSRASEELDLINSGQLSMKEAKFYRLPDMVLIDGGKGQLSAAALVMREKGYGDIPVFGLAKEEELIFIPESPEPVYLERMSGALHMVQRLRDEAHRFAVTYHRRIRDKKTLRSLLDEVDGIGPGRRKALIEAFGSIEKVKNASVDELAGVAGMNNKAAEAVYNFFRRSQG